MPQPTPNQVHIDTYLTNVSIKYAQEAEVFIAGRVFPQCPVAKKSDYYLKFEKGYFMRDEMEVRPLGGRPKRTGYGLTKGHYNCEEWSLEHPIDDRERENADQPLNPDLSGTELLSEKALIHRDKEWAARFFKTGIWATNWTGVASSGEAKENENKFLQFDQSGSEPIKFFDNRATEMREKTGRRPNRLVLGAKAYVTLKNNPAVVERIKYIAKDAPAVVTPSILAALFDVEEVLIAESVENTAPEGAADEIKFIVDPKSALLCYAAPSPSIQTPSAGYTFAWTGLLPGVSNAWGGVLYRGREELAHTDILQIRATYDMEVTASDLGMFFSGTDA